MISHSKTVNLYNGDKSKQKLNPDYFIVLMLKMKMLWEMDRTQWKLHVSGAEARGIHS